MLPVVLAVLPALAAAAVSSTSKPHSHASSAVNAAATTQSSSAAADRTTEAGEAQITNAVEECTYYNYAPVTAIIGTYPAIWATADLSQTGISDYDKSLFNALNSSIPDIAPRGTRAGDFTGVVYDGNADPDCWWTYNRCTTPKLAGLEEDVTKCNQPNSWGFTLDDGPNCSHNAYFDYLQSIEQKATLFYIGSNVLDWPLEAQRGLADGHEICAHTWSHPYMTSLTNEQAFAELYFSKKAIKDVLGITVRCWRPPYGDVDDRIRYIAKALDMQTIIWNEDTFDYDWATLGMAAVRANYDAILAAQKSGNYSEEGIIVLTHEIDAGTMELSQEYLPQMLNQFTGGVMPVAVCMNNTEPYIETADYVYPNYAQWMSGTHSVSLATPTAAGTAGEELVFGSSVATATSLPVNASATKAIIGAQATSGAQSAGVSTSTIAASVANAKSTTSTVTSGAAKVVGGAAAIGVTAMAIVLAAF
ncbi:hypothetical protein JCM1841_000025 [Sporobolomyces salmonicolor]